MKGTKMGKRRCNHIEGTTRSTCRKCGSPLKDGDPCREYQSLKTGKPYWRYMGECQRCTLDTAFYYRWLKRSPGEIQAAIDQGKQRINMLRKALKKAK
jgi:hypothetical protein